MMCLVVIRLLGSKLTPLQLDIVLFFHINSNIKVEILFWKVKNLKLAWTLCMIEKCFFLNHGGVGLVTPHVSSILIWCDFLECYNLVNPKISCFPQFKVMLIWAQFSLWWFEGYIRGFMVLISWGLKSDLCLKMVSYPVDYEKAQVVERSYETPRMG